MRAATWPGRLPLRDFRPGDPDSPYREAAYELEPTIVVLRTVGDCRTDWVRACAALERVLLTATVRGLASTPITQPLEVPVIRALINDPAAHRYAQVVLRLGYGPPAAASPRRPLEAALALGTR